MGKRWTDADIANLRPGMVAGTAPSANVPAVKKVPVKRKEAPELLEMKAWLRILKIEYVTEHRFHPIRKWRFDIAIPEHKLAIEYDGIFGENSGAHTGIGSFIKDCQKLNAATVLGWRVLRYTANNYQEFMKDIADLLNIKAV